MATVLLVEDDTTLANATLYAIETAGHVTHRASGMREALTALAHIGPDLVVLDVMLPDGDGFALCRRIRQTSRVPILFLTAKDGEEDVVRALDAGGDDYVAKPFRVRELISRIGALLRRAGAPATGNTRVLVSGGIEVRPEEGLATCDGRPLHLTPQEHRILCVFLRHPDQVLTRDAILSRLNDGGPLAVDDNTLSVYVRRLREKVEKDPSAPLRITTVRGVGYRWTADV